MSEAFQALLDSGVLYLALAALLCLVIGIGAMRRVFGAPRKQKTFR